MPRLEKIKRDLEALPTEEKRLLVEALLDELTSTPHRVSDEEVNRRADELRNGTVKGLTHEEFLQACED